MTEADLQTLRNFPHKYLSIGITEDGHSRQSVWVPWETTCNAFNMRTPDLYISPDELADEEFWTELGRFHVVGCYIFCPLEDYSFLDRLPELQDVTIHQGGALRNLSFLRNMKGWSQLHVEDAVLENLDDLFPEGARKGLFSICVCLSGCTVRDLSALTQAGIYLSELVILAPEGSNDRKRWKAVRCGKYSYFEYRVKK